MINNDIYPIQISKRISFEILTQTGVEFLICLILGIYLYFATNKEDILMIFFVPIFIFFILFIISLIQIGWNYLYLKSYKYECRKKDIYFSGGVISRFKKNLPYSRIQQVVLYETFWQRILGISSVSVGTARDFGSGIFIPDLLREDAIKLRDYIISISSKYKPIAGI